MHRRTRILGFALLVAPVLVAGYVWAGDAGVQTGRSNGDPPTSDDDGYREDSCANVAGVALDDDCVFADGTGGQAQDLTDYWDCLVGPIVSADFGGVGRFSVTPRMDAFPPPVEYGMELGQTGFFFADEFFGMQEICYMENDDDIQLVSVFIDQATTGFVGKIRKFEQPAGDGLLWIRINDDAELMFVTQGHNLVTLNNEIYNTLASAYVLVAQPPLADPYFRVLSDLNGGAITKITVRTEDSGLKRFELALEQHPADLWLNCSLRQ